MDNNRGNSGSVIKAIAIIYMVVGLIGSAVVAGQLADSLSRGEGGFLYFLVLSSFVFLVALVFYGFGELIGNTAETNGVLTKQLNEINKRLDNMEQERKIAAPQAKSDVTAPTEAEPEKQMPAKEPVHIVDMDSDFFESLQELDSVGEMVDRLSKKYAAQSNPDID